jgi:hypothetical protein
VVLAIDSVGTEPVCDGVPDAVLIEVELSPPLVGVVGGGVMDV